MRRSLLPLAQNKPLTVRDRICFAQGDEAAIRTESWHLRVPGDGAAPELFVKPDDRFEKNEVADRCPEIVSGLVDALQVARQLPPESPPATLAPLADELR